MLMRKIQSWVLFTEPNNCAMAWAWLGNGLKPRASPETEAKRKSQSHLVSQSRLCTLEYQFRHPLPGAQTMMFRHYCETQSTGRHHAARISVCNIWNCVSWKPPQIARQVLREFLRFGRNFVCSLSLSCLKSLWPPPLVQSPPERKPER